MKTRTSQRLPLWLALLTGFLAGFIAPLVIGLAQLALTVLSLALIMFAPQYATGFPDMGGSISLLVPLLLCVLTVPAGLISGLIAWLASRFIEWANFPVGIYLLCQGLIIAAIVFGASSVPLIWAVNLNWPFGGFYLVATGGFALSMALPLLLVNAGVVSVRRIRARRSVRGLVPETVQVEDVPA